MKKEFIGLKEWDAQPHYLKDFTKGKTYDMYLDDSGYLMVESDAGISLEISNNKLKEYFR